MVPGRGFDEIVRSWLARNNPAAPPERLEQWLAERLRQHREATGTTEQKLANGSWVLLTDRRMRNGGIAGLRIDISRLKAAQGALRDSEKRLDRAQEMAGIGSWEFD